MLRLLIAISALSVFSLAAADESEDSAASAHILQAEIALSRSEYLRATREYRMAALAAENVDYARRATLVADSFGFDDEALRSATRWRELDQDSDEALWYLARLQLREGRHSAARKSFRKLISIGDGEPDHRLMALVQALSDEDTNDTYRLLSYLAKPYPDSAEAHYSVALAALADAQEEVALQRSQKAIDLEGEWLRPKLLHGRALLIAGREEEAIEYTARIIGDDPAPDPEARLELAVLMMSMDRNDDALSQVNQILLEQPSRSDALRLMAIINFRLSNLDAAWDDFEDLLETGYYRNDAMFYLARIADIREDYEQAVLLYAEVESGDNVVLAQRRAASLLAFELDDADDALRQLDDFAHDHPAYAIDLLLSRAQLLSSLERNDDALKLFDELREYRPDSESVMLGRAELLLGMGRLDEAIEQYRQSAKRWPDSSISLNALGYTLADRTDEYRQAEKLIRKALKLDPDSAAIIDSLGWVLHKRGHHEKALTELQRAYDMFDDPEVAAHLVEVLVALARRDEALQMLVAAEEKDPDSELLEDVRERLFPERSPD